MTRFRPLDYAGAVGRVSPAAASRLRGRLVVQPKLDGCYATVHLDKTGKIAAIRGRSAREFPRAATARLLGAFVGWPDAVLVGELAWGTERSTRTGTGVVHLHDVLRTGRGVYVGHQPYYVRRDHLWRMQSEVVNLAPAKPWSRDRAGLAHSVLTGRFCTPSPTDFRLTPIVPQLPVSQFDEAWSQWGPDNDGEGVVIVALDATVGKRGAKRKVKRVETLDCVVVDAGRHALRVSYGGQLFAVSARNHGCSVGDIVEVAHEGWMESRAHIRFPRMVRRRADLSGSVTVHGQPCRT